MLTHLNALPLPIRAIVTANRMRLRLQPLHYMQCGCCVRPTGSLTRDKRTVSVEGSGPHSPLALWP